jgi:hypothetical protein
MVFLLYFNGRVEHKDFLGWWCVHSHFMKSECWGINRVERVERVDFLAV